MTYGNFYTPVGQIWTKRITATATPTVITTTGTSRPRAGRNALEICVPNGGATVYIGNKDVTTDNGLPVYVGESRIFPIHYQGDAGMFYMVGSGDVIVAEYTE